MSQQYIIGGKNTISTEIEELQFSCYTLPGVKTMLKTLPENDYVLCIGYGNDCQPPSVSGKKKFGESDIDACKRELFEETRTNCSNITFQNSVTLGKKNFNIYTVDATNVTFDGDFTRSTKRDDRCNNVYMIVHGPFDIMKSILEKVHSLKKDEGIVEMYIVSMKDSIMIHQMAERRMRTKGQYTLFNYYF